LADDGDTDLDELQDDSVPTLLLLHDVLWVDGLPDVAAVAEKSMDESRGL
jgi:hypothetical protein